MNYILSFFKGSLFKKNTWLLIGSTSIILGFFIFGYYEITTNPNIPLLIPAENAQWIRLREPTILKIRPKQQYKTIFLTHFNAKKSSDDVILAIQAMKYAEIYVDGKKIFMTDSNPSKWRNEYRFNINFGFNTGRHELKIMVFSQNSHPALLVYSKSIGLYTGEHWLASNDNKTWTAALPVNQTIFHPITYHFMRADRAFLSQLLFFIPIFMLFFIITYFYKEQHVTILKQLSILFIPSRVRWIFLFAMLFLAINNIGKIPINTGMDIHEHLEYIRYIESNLRLPLASEGWEMFHAPLFYIIAAILYKVLLLFLPQNDSLILLRVIPLFCGIAQVEICYRTMKLIYPDSLDLQILGTLIGGFLPMNLYMSQVVGNEPLAAFFISTTIYFTIQILKPTHLPTLRICLITGISLGLAIITKITALLLILPLGVFIPLNLYLGNGDPKKKINQQILKRMLWLFGIAFIVCGWYFLRNWFTIGKFIVFISSNISWWQDPGYRTLEQIFSFGISLYYPIYCSVAGFWDSLYSTLWMDGFLSAFYWPPWNYDLMLSSAWLSLFLSISILIGIVTVLLRPVQSLKRGILFALSCVFVFIGDIFYFFLTCPILSAAKATFALGLTPCIAILCVEGFRGMINNRAIRAIIYGIIFCWAIGSYFTYFVL